MESIPEQIEYLTQIVEEIEEGGQFIAYNACFEECSFTKFKIETCINMAREGASLTQIVKYVPGVEMGDVYITVHDMLGIPMEVTEEEKRQIAIFREKLSSEEKITTIYVGSWGIVNNSITQWMLLKLFHRHIWNILTSVEIFVRSMAIFSKM